MEIRTAQKGLGKQCELVLRTLPQWFGNEEALLHYTSEIDELDTYTTWCNDILVGFISVKFHFDAAVELYVLGVMAEYHGQEYGSKLLEFVERDLVEKNVSVMQVKTLSPLSDNAAYAKTLKYYLKAGFIPLEDLDEIWGNDTQCRLMVKHIANRSNCIS